MREVNRNPEVQARTAEILEKQHGIAPEFVAMGQQWATQWQIELSDAGYADKSDPLALLTARDIALEYCPDVSRDENGHALFRAEYAAQQLLFAGSSQRRAKLYRTALEGDGIRVLPHFDRMDLVLGELLQAQEEGVYPFNSPRAELPQLEKNMPKTLELGGREEALYWFISCYFMRGQIESITAIRGLSSMYDARPDLFDPEQSKQYQPEYIEAIMREHGLGSGSVINSQIWVHNSQRLIDVCDSDPRMLFEGTTDYQELLIRIRNKRGQGFKGFQEKMVSMLAYWYMSAGLVPYHHHPLPVDLHVTRFSAGTGIIDFENTPQDGDILSQRTLDTLRSMFHDYSLLHGMSQLTICDAVWAHGSALCGDAVGNHMVEPDGRFKREGRKTNLVREAITYGSAQMKRHETTCGSCPISAHCSHTGPAKPYYLWGKLIIHPRPIPPQDELVTAAELHRANPRPLRGILRPAELMTPIENTDEPLF